MLQAGGPDIRRSTHSRLASPHNGLGCSMATPPANVSSGEATGAPSPSGAPCPSGVPCPPNVPSPAGVPSSSTPRRNSARNASRASARRLGSSRSSTSTAATSGKVHPAARAAAAAAAVLAAAAATTNTACVSTARDAASMSAKCACGVCTSTQHIGESWPALAGATGDSVGAGRPPAPADRSASSSNCGRSNSPSKPYVCRDRPRHTTRWRKGTVTVAWTAGTAVMCTDVMCTAAIAAHIGDAGIAGGTAQR
eukprot:scaffold15348_cov107-Isochrysis_galbana.AAC.3